MPGKRVVVIGGQAFSLVNFRSELMQDMQACGCEVYALAPEIDADSRQKLESHGIRPVEISLSRTGLNPFKDILDIVKLWRTLSRIKPDVVFSIAIKPVIYGSWAALLSGVPKRFALIPGLGYAFSAEVQGRWLIGRAVRMLYRFAICFDHGVLMQNQDDAREFVAGKIVSRDKILAIHATGVNLETWTQAPVSGDRVTFLIAARLLPEKGIRYFVEAARRIKADHPEARFVVLGGLDANPSAIGIDEMKGWVDEGVIEWPGHVVARPWIEECSVFVLPSFYREGVPRSIQEAMATGRPIITTDWIGCRETVVDGDNGFLVPPRDVDALADAMRRFIDQPELIETMGARSRALAEERFDVRLINKDMIARLGL